MFRKLGMLLFAGIAILAISCDLIDEDEHDCGLCLRFVYNHNMEFADAFRSQINSVDIFVFDDNDRFLFSQKASLANLIDGNTLMLTDVRSGNYKVLAIGGLSESFRLSDLGGEDIKAGHTAIEDIQFALTRNGADMVDLEIPGMWYAKRLDIIHDSSKQSTWDIEFMKDTNEFNIALVRDETRGSVIRNDDPTPVHAYSYEIVSPEGAVYSWENNPISTEMVTYKPYRLEFNNDDLWTGSLNMCRLLYDYPGYKLVVRNTRTFKVVWEYDLMKLLAATKPDNHSSLPMQEYLDRQSVWNMVIRVQPGGYDDPDAFLALSVVVNGWIVWINDIETGN